MGTRVTAAHSSFDQNVTDNDRKNELRIDNSASTTVSCPLYFDFSHSMCRFEIRCVFFFKKRHLLCSCCSFAGTRTQWHVEFIDAPRIIASVHSCTRWRRRQQKGEIVAQRRRHLSQRRPVDVVAVAGQRKLEKRRRCRAQTADTSDSLARVEIRSPSVFSASGVVRHITQLYISDARESNCGAVAGGRTPVPRF